MFTGTVQPLSMIPYTYAAFYHTYSSTPSTHIQKRTRRTPVKGHSGTSTGRDAAHGRDSLGDQRNLAPLGPDSAGSYWYRSQNITSSSCAERDQISSSKKNRDNHSSSDSGGPYKCRHESTASDTTKQATSAR